MFKNKRAVLLEDANASAPYTPGIISGGFLFIAGQVGRNAEGKTGATIEEQTQYALENIYNVLQAAGCDFQDVVG